MPTTNTKETYVKLFDNCGEHAPLSKINKLLKKPINHISEIMTEREVMLMAEGEGWPLPNDAWVRFVNCDLSSTGEKFIVFSDNDHTDDAPNAAERLKENYRTAKKAFTHIAKQTSCTLHEDKMVEDGEVTEYEFWIYIPISYFDSVNTKSEMESFINKTFYF
ncbi:hypothetical protein [Aliivibrio fischeri]|uniref:hypothetical protein n=1 Tax=Aliivibrio fischeri TaxID=668 RepID=UPI0007C46F5F|nr:hypothetical protein [Aliivibrio fischeri]